MPSEYATYRLGLTARIRSATDDLAWTVRGATSAMLAYRPGPADWSIHEHLSHVRDMDQEFFLPLLRWATVAHMLDPRDYSRREWHEKRYRPEEPLTSIMDGLARIRDEELLIFRDMSDLAWTRYREDTRWGPVTCEWIAETIYRHTLDHLQGIVALLQDLHLGALAPAAQPAPGREA